MSALRQLVADSALLTHTSLLGISPAFAVAYALLWLLHEPLMVSRACCTSMCLYVCVSHSLPYQNPPPVWSSPSSRTVHILGELVSAVCDFESFLFEHVPSFEPYRQANEAMQGRYGVFLSNTAAVIAECAEEMTVTATTTTTSTVMSTSVSTSSSSSTTIVPLAPAAHAGAGFSDLDDLIRENLTRTADSLELDALLDMEAEMTAESTTRVSRHKVPCV